MQRLENMRIQVGKVVHEEEAPQLSTASSSAKNKGRSTVSYRQSSAFDCTYLSLIIIVTGGFSKKSFLLLLFPRNCY